MYYYKLENPTIYKNNGKTYVKDEMNRYMLEVVHSIKELNEIYYLTSKLKVKNYNQIVITKFNELFFEHNATKYVLIKTINTTPHHESEIIKKEKIVNNNYLLDRSNWYFLWCKKNDYFEYQNSHITRKYKFIDESTDYYIGMAETAISYLKYNINSTNDYLTICHKRIKPEEMNNPMNLILDHRERDISEYLKYLFIKKQNNLESINRILNFYTYTKNEYIRIYARMLYPSYYFDIYEKVVNENEKERKLREILNRIDEYEKYLYQIYILISKKEKIKKVDWINEK